MTFDLICTISAETGALVWEKTADDVDYFEGDRDFRWKVKVLFMILYLEVDVVIILTGKGSIADKHLVNDDSHSPPVNQLAISRPS